MSYILCITSLPKVKKENNNKKLRHVFFFIFRNVFIIYLLSRISCTSWDQKIGYLCLLDQVHVEYKSEFYIGCRVPNTA